MPAPWWRATRSSSAPSAASPRYASSGAGDLGCKIVSPLTNLQNFANFWRGRSRLYQNEFLQENMRLTAFFKLYKICILLHRCNLKIFAKNRFEKLRIWQNFWNFSQNFANFGKFWQFFEKMWFFKFLGWGTKFWHLRVLLDFRPKIIKITKIHQTS